jgi:hypothetical protein
MLKAYRYGSWTERRAATASQHESAPDCGFAVAIIARGRSRAAPDATPLPLSLMRHELNLGRAGSNPKGGIIIAFASINGGSP